MRSDGELVSLTISGDLEAFGELLARHERSVHAIAVYILRNHHDAQDLTQDAFVSAYRSLRSLRDGNAFGPWVGITARRLAHDAAQRRRQTVPLERFAEIAAPDNELDVDSERLMSAVLALPEREAQVILLRHFDGHDVAAIAKITGDGVGTVTKRLSRAHARLRNRVEDEWP